MINAYITTCDATNHILPAAIFQLRQYWNIPANIVFIGYSQPKAEMYDYRFVSMAPRQESIDHWARDIYNIIKDDPNDLVIMTVDDALLNDYGDKEVFEHYVRLLNDDPEMVRAALGCYIQKYVHKVLYQHDRYDIILIDKEAKYRLVCGWSLWRKSHLLKYLAKSTNPWHFETAHQAPEGNLIGSCRSYAASYQIEGAVSQNRIGDNINILGLKPRDVRKMIELGILKGKKLIYGNYIKRQKKVDCPIQRYTDVGADFNIKSLKPLVDDRTYYLYKQAYYHIYNENGFFD